MAKRPGRPIWGPRVERSRPLTARIRLPAGARPGQVQLLTLGRTVAADVRDGVLRVTVPSVATHEVIAIDL